jgi:hypothetical protein
MRISRTLILLVLSGTSAVGCRVDQQPLGYCEEVVSTVCSAQTESDCLHFAGCDLKGGCVELGCENFTEAVACQTQGSRCHWTGRNCRPLTVGACGFAMDPAECAAGKGCIWNPGCGGAIVFCNQMENESACRASAQCHWTAAEN